MFQEQISERINTFLKDYLHSGNFNLESITDSASNRKYFRIKTGSDSYILTFSKNIAETHTFLYFSKIFRENGVPVPAILQTDDSDELYLQEDIGSENLLYYLNTQGESSEVIELYKKSLKELVKLQFKVSEKIDYSYCYDFQKFNESLIYNDLNYFKFCFFQPLEIPFSNRELLEEFTQIANKVSTLEPQGFTYRDFQTRNIMIKDSFPYFIDYQGGMKGNTVYDLVSLLWQAKAQLSSELKKELKDFYFTRIQNEINIQDKQLEEAYQYCLLIRMLQVLGVYGFRGILQRKQHFIESIFYGIENLKILTRESHILKLYPELERIIYELFRKESKIKIKDLIEK